MIKVEIGQYRAINKNTLKGTFSLLIHPTMQKILDCKHFENDLREWFSFPCKEAKKEGAKTEYIPLISYGDKAYREELNLAVLEAIRQFNGNANGTRKATGRDTLSIDSPPDWSNPPF